MRKAKVFGKTLILILFSSAMLYWHNVILLTTLLFFLLVALVFLPKKQSVWERLKPMLVAGLLVIFFQVFFNQAESLQGRLLFGYIIVVRLLSISLMVLVFMTVTSFSELVLLFEFLPYKFQLLIAMTFYLIPSILKESKQILLAQKARGLSFNPAAILVPLLHRVFTRAQTLSLTIVERGYEE